jgi:2-hydroxychromene-2-carboxylate isomerase
MKPKVEFYFDFGSPNAYLAYKVMPTMEARLGTKFELKPALLGGIFKATGNQSPGITLAGIPAKAAYEQKEIERYIAKHTLFRFKFNPVFPINTLQMMRGAMLAKKLDLFESYVDAIYSGMWEQSLNIGEPDVFQNTLEAAGLPAHAFAEHLGDSDVKAGLIASTEEAIARGVFGSPTFFVGKEMFFGKDRLRDVEEEYLYQASKAPAEAGA